MSYANYDHYDYSLSFGNEDNVLGLERIAIPYRMNTLMTRIVFTPIYFLQLGSYCVDLLSTLELRIYIP
jgi:hypothetical protein